MWLPRVRFALDGDAVDTVGWEPRVHTPFVPPRRVSSGGNLYLAPEPFADEEIRVPASDGVISIQRSVGQQPTGGRFSVARTDLGGDTVFFRSFPYVPMGYPDVVLDSIVARASRTRVTVVLADGNVGRSQVAPGPDSLEVRSALRASLDFPPFQPPVLEHWLGNDDRLWLRREDTAGPTQRWIILDPDGGSFGAVDLPRRARIIWSRSTKVWVVEPDDLGVPWLVRYELGLPGDNGLGWKEGALVDP